MKDRIKKITEFLSRNGGAGMRKAYFGIFFFFFIGGYLFFFTSALWMRNDGDAKRLTELNQEIDWNDREVTILRWEYSEEQKMMEVELRITNRRFDGVNAYEYSAMESGGKYLEAETVIEEPDWVILQIRGIPKRFSEISLRMEIPEDENAGMLRMYTNTNDVERVAAIERKSRTGYLAARYQEELSGYRELAEGLKDSISREEENISAIRQEIGRMEKQKEYETEEEAENTDRLIADAEGEIESAEARIEEYEGQIQEYQERISNLAEKIGQIQEGQE